MDERIASNVLSMSAGAEGEKETYQKFIIDLNNSWCERKTETGKILLSHCLQMNE
jgi:hypothetical protein